MARRTARRDSCFPAIQSPAGFQQVGVPVPKPILIVKLLQGALVWVIISVGFSLASAIKSFAYDTGLFVVVVK